MSFQPYYHEQGKGAVATVCPDVFAHIFVNLPLASAQNVLLCRNQALVTELLRSIVAWSEDIERLRNDSITLLRRVRALCMLPTVANILASTHQLCSWKDRARFAVKHMRSSDCSPLLGQWLLESVQHGVYFSPAFLSEFDVPTEVGATYVRLVIHLFTRSMWIKGMAEHRLVVPLNMWCTPCGPPEFTDMLVEYCLEMAKGSSTLMEFVSRREDCDRLFVGDSAVFLRDVTDRLQTRRTSASQSVGVCIRTV